MENNFAMPVDSYKEAGNSTINKKFLSLLVTYTLLVGAGFSAAITWTSLKAMEQLSAQDFTDFMHGMMHTAIGAAVILVAIMAYIIRKNKQA